MAMAIVLARLLDLHDLEAAGERGVLLEVFLVFGPGRGGDRAQLAARQRRLQQIGRVALPGLAAGADQGVRFVDEQNDRLWDGLTSSITRLQPVLEFALHAGAGLQQAEVERAQRRRSSAPAARRRRDAQRKAFDDGGFSDARLAGEDRIVLPAPRQDVDDLADFVVAAEHRIDRPCLARSVRSMVNWSSEGVLPSFAESPDPVEGAPESSVSARASPDEAVTSLKSGAAVRRKFSRTLWMTPSPFERTRDRRPVRAAMAAAYARGVEIDRCRHPCLFEQLGQVRRQRRRAGVAGLEPVERFGKVAFQMTGVDLVMPQYRLQVSVGAPQAA